MVVIVDKRAVKAVLAVRDGGQYIKGSYESFLRYPTKKLGECLAKQPPSRVILETSAEAFAVADLALLAGHEVRVVPSMLAPSLGIGARGIKTDRRDAQAELWCSIAVCSPRRMPTRSATSLITHQRGAICIIEHARAS